MPGITENLERKKVNPELALLLIEEGFGISVDKVVYQRNPGIKYFNFRKWRKTEDYAIKNDGRNKIYCIEENTVKGHLTKEEFMKKFVSQELYVVRPIGQHYTNNQKKQIEKDMKRIITALEKFTKEKIC